MAGRRLPRGGGPKRELNVRVPVALYERLFDKAEELDISRSWLVMQLLTEGLDNMIEPDKIRITHTRPLAVDEEPAPPEPSKPPEPEWDGEFVFDPNFDPGPEESEVDEDRMYEPDDQAVLADFDDYIEQSIPDDETDIFS